MADRTKSEHSEKGLSAGVLALVFFLWVGVCAIFFSLGYLVGYNERTSKFISTERVGAPSVVPPTVNPSTKSSEPRPKVEQPPEAAMTVPLQPISPPTAPNASTEPGVPPPKGPNESAAAAEGTNPTAAPTGEVGVGYTVQVAATRTKQDAERLVGILKGHGYPVFLVAPGQSGTKDELYRVQVGPFTSREDAEKVRARLVQEGFKPFIRQ